jgi:hypothetical protein
MMRDVSLELLFLHKVNYMCERPAGSCRIPSEKNKS